LEIAGFCVRRKRCQEQCFMGMKVSLALATLLTYAGAPGICQQPGTSGDPVIVQPGAPGQPSKTLTAATAVTEVKPPSEADIRFMQDMIMHHGQAVEMTELLKTRSKNPEVRELGRKIDLSQTDEMRYMKQWLADRGVPLEKMSGMNHGAMDHLSGAIDQSSGAMDHSSMEGMDHSHMDHAAMDHAAMDHSGMAGMDHSQMAGMDHGGSSSKDAKDPMDVAMMPGMLTPRQMQALRDSTGEKFDYLFLTGMMQHHSGALLMVKQLFAAPGAGQDPILFDFANDVDNTQQAEIDIMRGILRKVKP
jgi:uncharacterized protein (DUF305 family)